METLQQSASSPVNYRKLQKQCLRKNIKNILLQFKFVHLTSDIIVSLFEVEPVEINNLLNQLKLPFNKDSVAELLHKKAQQFRVEELENIHCLLQLYRTSFFSNRKKWTPINLLEPAEEFQCQGDLKIIRRNLLQAFRIKGLNAIVKVISHEDMIWVIIIEKILTRSKGVKLKPPVFLCYEVGTPYIFVASKVPDTVMQCILRAMQYKKHKFHSLEGKDVKSLLVMLKHKAMNQNNNSAVLYQPAEAEYGHRFLDFSKRKARKSYANKLFETKDPVSLDTLSVSADAIWLENNLVPEMSGEPFPVTMQLKSKNVIGMIKYMVTNDIVATNPVPGYMQTLLRSSKNKIHMCAQQRQNNTL